MGTSGQKPPQYPTLIFEAGKALLAKKRPARFFTVSHEDLPAAPIVRPMMSMTMCARINGHNMRVREYT